MCQWGFKGMSSACKRPFAVSMPMSAQSRAVPCVQMQSKSRAVPCVQMQSKVQSSPVCADAIKVQSSPVCADAIKVQSSPVCADAVKVQSSPVCADAVKVQSSPGVQMQSKSKAVPSSLCYMCHTSRSVSVLVMSSNCWQVGSTVHLVWRGMSDKFIDPSMFLHNCMAVSHNSHATQRYMVFVGALCALDPAP